MSKSWKRITKQSSYDELIDVLRSFGYQKTSKVEEFGQYRISGSIIDFFSIISNKPIRINFFEDKIETIKEFDPISQISSNEIDEIIICTNAIYNIQKSNIDTYLENIEKFFDVFTVPLRYSFGNQDYIDKVSQSVNDFYNELENKHFAGSNIVD